MKKINYWSKLMKSRVCKKCGKELDKDYKSKKCENCLIKESNKVRRFFKGFGKGVVGLGSLILIFYNHKNKK